MEKQAAGEWGRKEGRKNGKGWGGIWPCKFFFFFAHEIYNKEILLPPFSGKANSRNLKTFFGGEKEGEEDEKRFLSFRQKRDDKQKMLLLLLLLLFTLPSKSQRRFRRQRCWKRSGWIPTQHAAWHLGQQAVSEEANFSCSLLFGK